MMKSYILQNDPNTSYVLSVQAAITLFLFVVVHHELLTEFLAMKAIK